MPCKGFWIWKLAFKEIGFRERGREWEGERGRGHRGWSVGWWVRAILGEGVIRVKPRGPGGGWPVESFGPPYTESTVKSLTSLRAQTATSLRPNQTGTAVPFRGFRIWG